MTKAPANTSSVASTVSSPTMLRPEQAGREQDVGPEGDRGERRPTLGAQGERGGQQARHLRRQGRPTRTTCWLGLVSSEMHHDGSRGRDTEPRNAVHIAAAASARVSATADVLTSPVWSPRPRAPAPSTAIS